MVQKIQWISNLLQVLIVFISLLYAIIYWRKIKRNGYFTLLPIYIFISLVISGFWFFKQQINFPGKLIQNFFIPFEFFVFYNFFIKVLKGKKYFFILITLSVLFFLSIIIIGAFLYSHQTTYVDIISFLSNYGFSELFVIENILIVIPVLLYYISLYNRPYIKHITQDPTFLVMTGILFCFTISTPIFAFGPLIWAKHKNIFTYLYIINSLAYILMHLSFIKAFKSIK